jgi:integrase
MNLRWYISHGHWNCKVPVPGGGEKSFASGVKASSTSAKWRGEQRHIRDDAYTVVMRRIHEEGLKVSQTQDCLTFRAWVEEYQRTVSVLKKSHKDDVSRFRVIVQFFGDYDLESITKFDLLRFRKLLLERALPADREMQFNHGSKERRANATVNRYMELISCVFSYAELRPPKVKKLQVNRRKRTYEQWEVDAVLLASKEVDEEFHRLLIVAFNSGLRQGNIVSLTWSNINLGICEMYLPDSKSGEPLTAYLNDESRRVLVEQSKLFPNRDKVWRWDDFPRKYWTRTLKKAGVSDCWFHDIRRHVLTEVADAHGIHIAKEVAHHKSVTTTQIYVNPSKAHVKQAIRDLSSTRRKVVPLSTDCLPIEGTTNSPIKQKSPP